jgi:acyl dehydratase
MNMSPQLPVFMQAGWKDELGSHTFHAEEIITFAKTYDPQVFHVDANAAKNSVLGGLCASGWHTASMWMRKQRDYMAKLQAESFEKGLPIAEFGPSPGFENLKWMRPVYAGDTITFYNETLGCRESQSRPGWFILSTRSSGKNQNGDSVISFDSSVFLKSPA